MNKMESKIERFSCIMKKLLSDENKDKLLGDISEDIEESIMEIKDLIDSGEISYDQMRDELTKNLNVNSLHRPGSVAQMLIGCTSEDSCPMKQEELLDIPYFYDNYEDTLMPITRTNGPISDKSYAVIYVTGNYKDIGKDKLKELYSKGFKRVKIMHKTGTRTRYNITKIEDIHSFINSPEIDYSKYAIGAGVSIVSVILLLLLIRYLKSKNK